MIGFANVHRLPLVSFGVAIDGKVWTPTSCQHCFVIVIVKNSLTAFAAPGALIARVVNLGTTKSMCTKKCCNQLLPLALRLELEDVVSKYHLVV